MTVMNVELEQHEFAAAELVPEFESHWQSYVKCWN